MTRYLSFLCLAASLFCFTGCGGSKEATVSVEGDMTAEEKAEMEAENAINDPKAMEAAIKAGKDPYPRD